MGITTINAQLCKLQQCPVNKRIVTLWHSFEAIPDTTQTVLYADSVKTWAKQQEDERLYSYAEMFETHWLACLCPDISQRIETYLQKLDYFTRHTSNEIAGCYQFYLGSTYYSNNNFAQAFHYLIIAENIFNEIGYKNIPYSDVYASELFAFYYYFEDYPTAIGFAKIAC